MLQNIVAQKYKECIQKIVAYFLAAIRLFKIDFKTLVV